MLIPMLGEITGSIQVGLCGLGAAIGVGLVGMKASEAVGRNPAEITFTAGCKPIIRDTESEARQVWEAQMAHNRTPMDEVEDDDTFWVGTPELVAERMIERRALGFHTFLAEMAAPYDDETLERWIGEVKPMVDSA